ncbi:MAG TPA: DUF6279 family lipoprotein [Rhodoferax sp.]|nr:DUF6279 family lipoprotein [Rhodoferax sp.]
MSWRIISALLTLLGALLLGGCSVARLGYSQAPDLVYWWVDSYLDLSDAQSSRLRADLVALHQWHRSTELPLLAGSLADLQGVALQDTTPVRLCQLVDALRPRLQAVLDQAEPGFATLAVSLKPEQLAHLQRQLEKRQQKWRKDWLDGSPTERLERRTERLIDRSEMFYGRLDASQRALLRARVAASGFDSTLAEADMLRRQQDLLQTLQAIGRSGLGTPRAQDDIHQLLARLLLPAQPAERARQELLRQENCGTFAALHNSTSPAQRRQLVETLKAFESDARALMPGTSPPKMVSINHRN